MSDNILYENAISASSKAVKFDTEGSKEAAAAYFYRVAADNLERAAENVPDETATTWKSKANEYRNRAVILEEIHDNRQHNVKAQTSIDKELEKCYFLFNQALDADEAGFIDKALELYTNAVEIGIKYECDRPEVTDKIRKVARKALERAESIKGIKQEDEDDVKPLQSNVNEPTRSDRHVTNRPELHRGSSAHLKVVSAQDTYTDEEKRVLILTSDINNNTYVPFMQIDLSERFQYSVPFSDKDGLLELSPKQKQKFAGWVRPDELSSDPKMIAGSHVDYYSIKQTIISDCSFVASLAVSALYEKKFHRPLITSIIYPRNRKNQPIYNPFGKYMIKLHINGVPRKVIIDDLLPIDRRGKLLCSYSNNPNEFWVSLLEKAYMKVMGGYDFPGSNSNIDLHALTGWIPERISLKNEDPTFNSTKIFDMLQSRIANGDVLVTVATGEISEIEAERSGLVSAHAYAVLDVRNVDGTRLLLLKNPWSHLRWKGHYSELDTVHWTPELKQKLNYDPDCASQFDNGIFWIDFNSICSFYDVFYLNWNPKMFEYTNCIHKSWRAGIGPVKDAYNIGLNPQYILDVDSKSGCIWILLTRHITQIEDFKENREYITVLVYKNNGKRVYYPYDPHPFIDGIRINSPHYLCKITLNASSPSKYTLVISQYEKMNTIHYTLRAYSTCPFRLSEIKNPYIHEKCVSDGKWMGKSAGGCQNHPLTYQFNPRYKVELEGLSDDNKLYLDLKGPKEYQIGMEVRIIKVTDETVTAPFNTKSSGPFRSGFVYMELDNIPSGTLEIVPSTFLPNQEGPFFLTVKSSCPFLLSKIA